MEGNKKIKKELYFKFENAKEAAEIHAAGKEPKRVSVRVGKGFDMRSREFSFIKAEGMTDALKTSDGSVFAWWDEYSEPGKENELMGPVIESKLYGMTCYMGEAKSTAGIS